MSEVYKKNYLANLFDESEYTFEFPDMSFNDSTYIIKSKSESKSCSVYFEDNSVGSILYVIMGVIIFFLSVITISLISLYISRKFGQMLPSGSSFVFIISVLTFPFLIIIKISQLIRDPKILKLKDQNKSLFLKIEHKPSINIFSVKYNLLDHQNKKVSSVKMNSLKTPFKRVWKCLDTDNNLMFFTEYKYESFGFNREKYKSEYSIFNSSGEIVASLINNNITNSSYKLIIESNSNLNWLIVAFASSIDFGLNQRPFTKLI